VSISFSYVPFLKAAEAASRQTYFVHILFFLIGMTIVSLLGKGLISKLKELQKAFRFIKRLEGLLPICAHCKKIRTEGADPRDQESWVPIEVYIEGRTDAQFTHGICPACVKRHYGLQFNE